MDTAGYFIKDRPSSAVGYVADPVPAVHVLAAGDLRRYREVSVLSGTQFGTLWLLEVGSGGAVYLCQVVALGLTDGKGQAVQKCMKVRSN